ncbi:type II secretion system F family protein [Enterobacteriaceae bacterium RIT693]|jgi:tight adherence protein C|nr:type II secretion system F family protein [Enterobacteriaceae bacterium RIT693]
MYIIIIVVMLLLGIGGLLISRMRQAKRTKIFSQLDAALNAMQDMNEQNDSSQVERALKKTSRLVSLSAMLDKNVMAKAIVATVSTVILFISNAAGIYEMSADIMIICILVVLLVVILLPNAIKNATIKKRMKSVANDFPFVIDMMAVCVQSGMTVEKALRYIAENINSINPDIAILLERTMLKAEVGGMSVALEQLYQEVANNEVRMFCSTLQQSIKFGSSIYQVLIDLSKEMRAVQLISTEEKVASLSAKMTLPMIAFIMFPLLIIVAGPGIIGMISS